MKNSIIKLKNSSYFELLVRISLGVLFFYSSLHKIGNPEEFAKVIYGYSLFPGFLINIFAIVVPFFELLAGISLILGIYPRSGITVINIMLVLFIIAISINLIRGHEFDCGCISFGEKKSPLSNVWLLVRDFISLFAGVYLLMFDNGKRLFCIRKGA